MREEEEGREEGERENRCNRQERKDTKKGQVTKMPGFYREGPLGEGQPSPGLEGSALVCPLLSPTPSPPQQVGTEGCWERLASRSALIIK